MKTIICDICEKDIGGDKKYDLKVREFYLAAAFYEHCVLPEPSSRKRRIHLCGDCYDLIKKIAKGEIKQ